MVMVEFSGSQIPDSQESEGTMTLVTKTGAVRTWLLRERQELSAQKTRTYESSAHLSIREDGKFKFPPVAIVSFCLGHIEPDPSA